MSVFKVEPKRAELPVRVRHVRDDEQMTEKKSGREGKKKKKE